MDILYILMLLNFLLRYFNYFIHYDSGLDLMWLSPLRPWAGWTTVSGRSHLMNRSLQQSPQSSQSVILLINEISPGKGLTSHLIFACLFKFKLSYQNILKDRLVSLFFPPLLDSVRRDVLVYSMPGPILEVCHWYSERIFFDHSVMIMTFNIQVSIMFRLMLGFNEPFLRFTPTWHNNQNQTFPHTKKRTRCLQSFTSPLACKPVQFCILFNVA